MSTAVASILYESFALLAVMAPYLLVGFAAAGLLHVLVPLSTVSRHLGGPGIKPVLKAVLLGVPLPVCSCGVVPIAASLKKSGASNGATVGFLVTTPTTGIDSILATYSVLGGAFAALRVVVTAVLGLVAGVGTSLVDGGRGAQQAAPEVPADGHAARRGFAGRLAAVFEYAAVELFGGIARPLVIGIAAGGLIAYFLPAGALERTIGQGFLSYLAMMALGIPLYVCASGSIPLAVALIAKGLSPGAALVFLIVGPATNIATVAIVGNMLGRRPLAVYLATLSLGALGAGFAADAFFAAFPSFVPAVSVSASCHAGHGLGAVEIGSGAVVLGLVGFHLSRAVVARVKARKASTERSGELTLRVPDMNCNHCVMTITDAVSKIEGGRLLSADPQTKLVTFESASPEWLARAAAAIREAGFHPEDAHEGLLALYGKLPWDGDVGEMRKDRE